MVERLENLATGRIGDVLSVVLPNGTVLAAMNLIPLNSLVQIAAALVTIGYAVWRWRRDSYVACKPCIEGRLDHFRCPYPPDKRPAWCPMRPD